MKTKRGNVLGRVLAVFLCLGALVGVLTACDPMGGHYPPDYGKKWVCQDPEIVLISDQNSDRTWYQEKWILWNGEKIPIQVSYRANRFYVSLDKPSSEDLTILKGTWRYKGDKLLFRIEWDGLFDGAYETLVFTKEE